MLPWIPVSGRRLVTSTLSCGRASATRALVKLGPAVAVHPRDEDVVTGASVSAAFDLTRIDLYRSHRSA